MAKLALAPEIVAVPIPVGPSAEVWRAMSPAERVRFFEEVTAALERQAELSPEGRPHSVAKMGAAGVLGDYFDRIGRPVYLACELPVIYEDEHAFAPDVMAVVGVEDPGPSDTRIGWVVADEGRGLDLVLEILCYGDRNKDLVSNVARYARLGIPEYFVYDRLKQRLDGYRLAFSGATRYSSIAPHGALFRSEVLGLDLGVLDGQLRFFLAGAQLPESRELIARLERMMSEREGVLAERDRQLQEEMAARAEAERQRDEAVARADRAEAELAELAELRRRA